MKAIFFDMDGVLIDSENFYMTGTYDWIKKKGFKGSFFEVLKLIGTDMTGTYNLLYKMLNGRYTIDEIKQMNTKYFKEHPICYKDIMFDKSEDFLSFLKENNVKTALCSSSDKKLIKKVLIDCKIEKYFDIVISAEDVKNVKPNPEIYLKAKDALNIKTEDIFVIEDSTMGIEAGKRAGFKVIAIKDERFNQDQSKADICLKDFLEIKNFLKKEFNLKEKI